MNISYFLKDDSGNWSSKRLLALTWGLSVLGVWVAVSIKTWEMAPLSWGHCGIVLSLAGVVAAGKWGEGLK